MDCRMPFIDINEFNICKIKNVSLSYFLNWIGKSARTKKQLLAKYFQYSFICSKRRWLSLIHSICSYNCLVFDEEKWSYEFDIWIQKGCSYSVHFI